MNSVILRPVVRKQYNRLRSLTLECQTLKKGNSDFKPANLHLKIDLVSYPAPVEGLGMPMAWETKVQPQVESYQKLKKKTVLHAALRNTQHYKV